jgi:23S rRNA pseudouridine1911/1915/1917 synthase
MSPPTVLFEDHHLLVLNKPAPLLTQAPDGVPCLEAWAKAYIKEKYNKPAGVYLAVPHRLDRPVSGVIVFARNTKAAQRLQAQFEYRTVQKTYWALVEGHLSEQAGTWEDWLRKVPEEARVERAEPNAADAKLAKLSFKLVAKLEHHSVLELEPETGRMHQLRVQSAWRGHPILGDAQYSSSVPFGPKAELPRDAVIALHARTLQFEHPFRSERLTFTAPLPDYWPQLPDAILIS